jgi:hypothetical protein
MNFWNPQFQSLKPLLKRYWLIYGKKRNPIENTVNSRFRKIDQNYKSGQCKKKIKNLFLCLDLFDFWKNPGHPNKI